MGPYLPGPLAPPAIAVDPAGVQTNVLVCSHLQKSKNDMSQQVKHLDLTNHPHLELHHVTHLPKADWLRSVVTYDVVTNDHLVCLAGNTRHLKVGKKIISLNLKSIIHIFLNQPHYARTASKTHLAVDPAPSLLSPHITWFQAWAEQLRVWTAPLPILMNTGSTVKLQSNC